MNRDSTRGVVWITDEVPDRRRGGGGARQEALLRAVAARTPVEVVLVGGAAADAIAAAALLTIDGVTVRRLTAATRRRRRLPVQARNVLTALAGRSAPELDDHRGTVDATRAWLRSGDAGDRVVVLHHQHLIDAADAAAPGLAVAHLFHVASGQRGQEADLATGLRRWVRRRFAEALDRRMTAALARCAAVVAVCEEDAALLRRPGLPEPVVIPHGFDHLPPLGPVPIAPLVILTGSLDYPPNVDGARWFADSVWPLVRAARPDAQLRIVGRHPDPAVVALGASPGITVVADVPDITPELAAARVSVVPLRIGTGTRVKAQEALCAGRPLAGTTVGLAGLGIEPGIHALVADDSADLAAAVLALLDDDELAGRLVAAGHDLAAGWTWQDAGARFVEVLESIP